MAQSLSSQKFLLDNGKVGVILMFAAPAQPVHCTFAGLDDLEVFALQHLEESPELFKELALLIQQADAHQQLLQTV